MNNRMKVDLNNKVAIVTGGAGGIGSAIAKEFAKNGAYIYLCDVNEENGKKIEKELLNEGGLAKFMRCDVRSDEDCKTVVDDALKEHGKIDILVNNAGGNIALDRRGKIRQYTEEGWDFSIDVCMDGMFHFNRYVLPAMKKSGGRIINTGSVTGFRAGLRNQCAYNMAKAAIHSLTRSLAIEYAQYGITVNSIIPGTTWHENFYKGLGVTEDTKQKFLSHVPLKQPNTPQDMANGALYLCSEEAKRVTGVLFNIDGGWASGYCME